MATITAAELEAIANILRSPVDTISLVKSSNAQMSDTTIASIIGLTSTLASTIATNPIIKNGLGTIGLGASSYSLSQDVQNFKTEWNAGQVSDKTLTSLVANTLAVAGGVASLAAVAGVTAFGMPVLAVGLAVAGTGLAVWSAFETDNDVSDMLNDLGKQLQAIKDLLGDSFNNIVDFWKSALQGTGDLWANYFNSIAFTVNDLWNAAQNWALPRHDPLVLDMDGDGIETVGINAVNDVVFDADGDGLKTGTGWVKADDALLVYDRNGNGTIDDGSEFFGDQTMVEGVRATDGFAALSAEDTNDDGVFDANDANYANVRVWQDKNQDGISQSDELRTLAEAGIASISLSTTTTNKTTNGNTQTMAGTYTKTDGTTGAVGNYVFAQNGFYREFTDHLTLTDTALALPDMQGSGMVRDLREASTLSAGLTSTLQSMSTTYETHDEMMAQIDTMLEQWAETSSMATSVELALTSGDRLVYVPTQNSGDYELYMKFNVSSSSGSSGGVSIPTAPTAEERARYEYLLAEQAKLTRMISILERFNGETFVTIIDNTVTGSSGTSIQTLSASTSSSGSGGSGMSTVMIDPRVFVGLSASQISFLEQSYEALKQSVYDGLVQMRLSTYLDAIELTISENGLKLDISGVIELLNIRAEDDLKNALNDWNELIDYVGNNIELIDVSSITKLKEWVGGLGDNERMLTELAELNGELIFGKDGGKVLYVGSINNDVITNTERADIIISGSGDDVITSNGSTTVYAGDGNDTVVSVNGNNILHGGEGNDAITTGNGNDTLYGDAGDDRLYSGLYGTDVLSGGAGDDILEGGLYNDTYVFNRGDGQDIIYDGGNRRGAASNGTDGGNDTISFGEGVSAGDVAFYFENSSLYVEYGFGDIITIEYQKYAANAIEKFTLSDGNYLTSSDVNLIIQSMNAYASTNDIAIESIESVKTNQDLMNIVAAGWHQ